MSEFLKDTEKQDTTGFKTIQGKLTCERCFEVVIDGRYDTNNQILYFICSKKHKNQVKGLDL